MRYRLQRHDGTDCSATMVPITVLRMVPIQRYRQNLGTMSIKVSVWDKILKVIIAVASAIAGVIGGQAIGI